MRSSELAEDGESAGSGRKAVSADLQGLWKVLRSVERSERNARRFGVPTMRPSSWLLGLGLLCGATSANGLQCGVNTLDHQTKTSTTEAFTLWAQYKGTGHGWQGQAQRPTGTSGSELKTLPDNTCALTYRADTRRTGDTAKKCTSLKSDHHSPNPWVPVAPYDCKPVLSSNWDAIESGRRCSTGGTGRSVLPDCRP